MLALSASWRSPCSERAAELANLVNEAALLAARQNARAVSMQHFEEAKDKVMMGMERKSLIISEKERKVTSYHEIGHVLVARMTPRGRSRFIR